MRQERQSLAQGLEELVRRAGEAGLQGQVSWDEPLAPHTTLRVGGPADLCVRVTRLDDLAGWVRLARRHQLPFRVLGYGSNVLVSDQGLRGLVILNRCQGHRLTPAEDGQTAELYAESGASLPGLAHEMARQGWAGLEWAVGIPSTIGAAVVNNAGAYGGCIADVLLGAEVMGPDGRVSRLPPESFHFDYRTSRLKGQADQEIVLSATFQLRAAPAEELLARIAEQTGHRRRTQPTEPSAGSIFKNPPGDFAGRLLERAGLKGQRVGDAQVSEVHANWIVNRGQATAAEVWRLIQLMRRAVREMTGVELELEIEPLGAWDDVVVG
jgi:UDP-N-acetylmuramate dehydrogenase